MEITKREVIASISILAIMLILGSLLSYDISRRVDDKNKVYTTAVHISDAGLFQYAMDTNVGNSFIYGEIQVVDPVTYSEIDGQYWYVEKVKEEYTRHTRVVTETKYVNGKPRTTTRTEVYYSWDEVDSEEKSATVVTLLGKEFDASKFRYPSTRHIDTIGNSHVRYCYYGSPAEVTGTVFADLRDGDMSGSRLKIYSNKDTYATLDYVTKEFSSVLFWILWMIVTGLVIFGFYYLDNNWLY